MGTNFFNQDESSSHLPFSPGLLLKSKLCNYSIELTWLQLGRISFILSESSGFHMVVNLSMAVYA